VASDKERRMTGFGPGSGRAAEPPALPI